MFKSLSAAQNPRRELWVTWSIVPKFYSVPLGQLFAHGSQSIMAMDYQTIHVCPQQMKLYEIKGVSVYALFVRKWCELLFDVVEGLNPFAGYTESMRAIVDAGTTRVVNTDEEKLSLCKETILSIQKQQALVDKLIESGDSSELEHEIERLKRILEAYEALNIILSEPQADRDPGLVE